MYEIQKLIDLKSDRATFESNGGKVFSDVWKQFMCVKVDGNTTEFVKCVKCHHAMKWRSRDGTRGMKAHVDSCGTKTQRHCQLKSDTVDGLLFLHGLLS